MSSNEDSSAAKPDNFSSWIVPPIRGCWHLTGPTGSGKTSLALELAERHNAEIISVDSMAIYQGMDIGTAKPTADDRARVPHHMLDIVPPTESYSVSTFVIETHRIAADIQARGKNVLLCGGTPLYLKSLIRGLFLGPEADWDFRAAVEHDTEKHGTAALIDRLRQVDPLLAHKLHPNDHRRMIRALEVAKITGRPLSHWQQQFETPARSSECPVAVLKLDRAWLHERINARVDNMLQLGLLDEVRGLLQQHQSLGRTAAQAVGYKEMIEHLHNALPIESAIERVKAHSRQFARRQEIWFRGLSELQPIALNHDSDAAAVVADISRLFEACPQNVFQKDSNDTHRSA